MDCAKMAATEYQQELVRLIKMITMIKDHIVTFLTIRCDKQNLHWQSYLFSLILVSLMSGSVLLPAFLPLSPSF